MNVHCKFAIQFITFAALIGWSIGSNLRSSSNDSTRRELMESIPKILHSIVLGDPPKQYMIEFVKFTEKKAKSHGFKTMLWSDKHIENLVKRVNREELNGITHTWEFIKRDTSGSRYAKMADFIRLVLLYSYGGVYFDADVIACGSLDFMVDTPGVVSFPFHPHETNEVSQGLMSAPPHHPLIKLALQEMIIQGPEIATNLILDATGPGMMGRVTDAYFKKHGIDIPPVRGKHYRDNDVIEGKTFKDNTFYDLKVADVQFGDLQKFPSNVYHFAFKSWIPGQETHAKCFDEPKMIEPFFDYFCAHEKYRPELTRNFHALCGKTYLELTKTAPLLIMNH